jgi:cell division protein FtsZ
MSPLLEINIQGARGILFNVTGGSDLGLFEVNEAAEVIKEAADPEANIIFGTVIDDRMRDEVKVTVIATGFDAARSRPKPAVRPASAEAVPGIESSLDEKSRELLAEIERDRIERTAFTVTPAPEPVDTESESEVSEVTHSPEREPVAARPTTLDRPAYGDTDLDIPSFLRQPNREHD